MRKRTSHSDSIVSETRYDVILAALPVPLFVGVTVGALTGQPLSLTTGAGGFVSALVLAYGLFVAAPTDAVRSSTPDVSLNANNMSLDANNVGLDATHESDRDEPTTTGRRYRGI
ncbi:hypothetical protein C453_17474 [Haloferax elongans ATCC BAA-1513]|uniref:Uncharacterized protein n=1 Tax=Haloferax elongans ATCC BAA-1513 TaxID=1230453 RepID=M0HFG0_HALEO|nr:hypothetical protein [Haloferax elongans]ELZ81829.1 hypothetical protein C453_17474 [Haloferax elongans ATCC BAA-1513]